MRSNANNIAVALPVEILHAIFAVSAGDSHGPNVVLRRPRYAPNWIAITYVCQRWRAVALGFRKLWSTITPDLSPKWIAACLKRSSHAPKYVSIYVGPPSKKSPKKRYFGTSRRPVQEPLMSLPGEVIRGVFSSHASRIEILHLEGDTVDVIRTLTSLDMSMPLSSLSLDLWDEFKYPHLISNERRDTSLILPKNTFGGSASRLRRLHCRSGLHVIFPSCVLRTVSEFSVSCSFCPNRLFASLSHMPQLEVLRVSSLTQQDSFHLHSSGVSIPVDLKNLSLLVIEDASLEPLTTLLDCLSVPVNVRRHLKLKLDESKFDTSLWERFSSLMREATTSSSDPLRGIHLRREPSLTSIRIWTTLHEPEPGLVPSPWPPLDDPFSLEIHCADRSCLYMHTVTSSSIPSFHRLQELCVSLGGKTVQELFVEYGTDRGSCHLPWIPHRCWRTLFSGLSSLKTLHFGEGAADLLVSASYGVSMGTGGITTNGPRPCQGSLSENVQQVVISRSAFSTRVLWNWIHYAFVRPAEADVSLLRENVLALLSEPHWKEFRWRSDLDVTESLLLFLLCCKPMGVQVSELSLVGSTWDEPGGLEILQWLIHMLDPDCNVILETVSPD